MKLIDCLDRDVCEWQPVANRPAICSDEYHGDAVVLLGGERHWRLCERCALLPKFRRYRIQHAP